MENDAHPAEKHKLQKLILSEDYARIKRDNSGDMEENKVGLDRINGAWDGDEGGLVKKQ